MWRKLVGGGYINVQAQSIVFKRFLQIVKEEHTPRKKNQHTETYTQQNAILSMSLV